MPRGPKNARYELTDVWGCMEGIVKIGDVLVDTYRGNERSWNIARGTDMEAGGMAGRFIGRLAHNDGSLRVGDQALDGDESVGATCERRADPQVHAADGPPVHPTQSDGSACADG